MASARLEGLEQLPPDLRAVVEKALPSEKQFAKLEAEAQAEAEARANRERAFLELVADKAERGEFGQDAQAIARAVLDDGGRSHVNLTRLAKALRDAKRQKIAAERARKKSRK